MLDFRSLHLATALLAEALDEAKLRPDDHQHWGQTTFIHRNPRRLVDAFAFSKTIVVSPQLF